MTASSGEPVKVPTLMSAPLATEAIWPALMVRPPIVRLPYETALMVRPPIVRLPCETATVKTLVTGSV